jgi:hypothetical protein
MIRCASQSMVDIRVFNISADLFLMDFAKTLTPDYLRGDPAGCFIADLRLFGEDVRLRPSLPRLGGFPIGVRTAADMGRIRSGRYRINY